MSKSKVRWFTDELAVEMQAREQIERTASMPFVRGLAVMPDVHLGKGSTVGTVVATKGAVMPACVGVDIGCGMIAVETTLCAADIQPHAADIRKGIERRIPVGIGPYGMNSKLYPATEERIARLEESAHLAWGNANHMNARAKDWRMQLGTLGGGNHFIEICAGRAIPLEPMEHGREIMYWNQTHPEKVWVILHSGSRAVGNKTGAHWTAVAQKQAKKYLYDTYLPDPDLAYLVEHSEEYWTYFAEARWCQQFAHHNREEMMQRVLEELTRTVGAFDVPTHINCHHNYVGMEHHDGENLLITRKGAISAGTGERGLIPGSMGARSYIVSGLGHAGSYLSAPHGAGRRMSRNAARKHFTLEGLTAEMAALGIEARIRPQIIDEAPGAYKNIDMVMFDARELVMPTHALKQIISVKGD